jgi:hypothetical protein
MEVHILMVDQLLQMVVLAAPVHLGPEALVGLVL